jgi:rubredoxin
MNILKAIWNNPKHRNILILSVLILLLICLIIYRIMNIEQPPPEGSLRVVVCTKCQKTFTARIKDIKDSDDERNRCKECQGKLAIAWKCNDCQFEYPTINLQAGNKEMKKTMDKFKAIVESRRCPNCSSLSAHPMSVDEFKGKK